MSEETRRILDMLSKGTITVDEADQLLTAVGSAQKVPPGAPAAQPEGAVESPAPRYLRIAVKKTRSWAGDEADAARRAWMWPGYEGAERSKEVTIRVPIAVVKHGMRLGAIIPGIATNAHLQAHLRERGLDVDLSKIDGATIDQIVREFGEMNIDIDSGHSRKAQVRITCE